MITTTRKTITINELTQSNLNELCKAHNMPQSTMIAYCVNFVYSLENNNINETIKGMLELGLFGGKKGNNNDIDKTR